MFTILHLLVKQASDAYDFHQEKRIWHKCDTVQVCQKAVADSQS